MEGIFTSKDLYEYLESKLKRDISDTQKLSIFIQGLQKDFHSDTYMLVIWLNYIHLLGCNDSDDIEIRETFKTMKVKYGKYYGFWREYLNFEIKTKSKSLHKTLADAINYVNVTEFADKEKVKNYLEDIQKIYNDKGDLTMFKHENSVKFLNLKDIDLYPDGYINFLRKNRQDFDQKENQNFEDGKKSLLEEHKGSAFNPHKVTYSPCLKKQHVNDNLKLNNIKTPISEQNIEFKDQNNITKNDNLFSYNKIKPNYETNENANNVHIPVNQNKKDDKNIVCKFDGNLSLEKTDNFNAIIKNIKNKSKSSSKSRENDFGKLVNDFLSFDMQKTSEDIKNQYFHINEKKLLKCSIIGKGGSSKVYKVFWNNSFYALKVINIELEPKLRDLLCDEINLLVTLKNEEGIIQIIDYQISNDYIYILLEYGESDLSKYIKNNKLSMNLIKCLWEQILQSVNVIHEKRIIHADLKPANFVFVHGKLKLIDFGISKVLKSENTTRLDLDIVCGTIDYVPPELLLETGKTRRRSSDVWSLGIILYEMMYGRTPLHKYKDLIEKKEKIKEIQRYIEWNDFNRVGIEVVRECLNYEPKQRPTIKRLLNHKFLRSELEYSELLNLIKTCIYAEKKDNVDSQAEQILKDFYKNNR